jgi:hypothetical protein
MASMRMPGFTADHAIYVAHEGYRSTADRTYDNAEQRVIAQLRNSFGCAGCVWTCFVSGGPELWGCYTLCRAFGYCDPF